MRKTTSLMAIIGAIAIACTSAATDAIAQTVSRTSGEPHLLVSGRQAHGGFGSMDARVTRLAGGTALLTGARGGWLIGHQLSIGAAAWWNASPRVNSSYILPSGKRAGLGFGYAGVEVGWTYQPAKLVHLTASALLGGGGVNYYELGAYRRGYERTPIDGFIVAEPTLGIDLNVSRYVRLGAVAGYRATSGASLGTLGDKRLSGASGGMTVKIGKF